MKIKDLLKHTATGAGKIVSIHYHRQNADYKWEEEIHQSTPHSFDLDAYAFGVTEEKFAEMRDYKVNQIEAHDFGFVVHAE